MLKVRVIPTLLWRNFGLVKGLGFDNWRRVGPVLPAINVYNSRDVDELILVDITASQEGNDPDHDSVRDFSEECAVPLTVGGAYQASNRLSRFFMRARTRLPSTPLRIRTQTSLKLQPIALARSAW